MKHEPRCIEFPCTCVEILRQKVQELTARLEHDMKELQSYRTARMRELEERNKSLERKIADGLSCCCAGCSRHNQNILPEKYYEDLKEGVAPKDPV